MAKKIISTFSRHEIKFFASPAQAQSFLADVAENITIDEYCRNGQRYNIKTVYYDTPDKLYAHRSLQKPYYKEKLRMRCYETPSSGDSRVFVELKKKVGGLCFKRRCVLTFDEANALLEKGELPDKSKFLDMQVAREIQYLVKQTPVEPSIFLSYDRFAFFDKTNKDIRLTLDSNILGRYSAPEITAGGFDNRLLDDDTLVMEIKVPDNIPFYIARALAKNNIVRSKFSKYTTEYKYMLEHGGLNNSVRTDNYYINQNNGRTINTDA